MSIQQTSSEQSLSLRVLWTAVSIDEQDLGFVADYSSRLLAAVGFSPLALKSERSEWSEKKPAMVGNGS